MIFNPNADGDKVKKEKFNFDEADVRPYFELNNVVNGMFYVAERLFGIKFIDKKLSAKKAAGK